MTTTPAVPPGGGPAPTPSGLPQDPLEAARAINGELARRVNVPGPAVHGILLSGAASSQAGPAAQVSIAHSLADIATSLRKLSGRDTGPGGADADSGQ